MLMKFISNSPVIYLAANTFQQLPQPTVVSVAQNLVFALNRWDNSYTCGRRFLLSGSNFDLRLL